MKESALMALVGNDPNMLEELVAVVAGVVLTCLTARRAQKGAENDTNEDSVGAPEPSGDCVHQAVVAGTSPVPPGEYGAPVCASGEGAESGLAARTDSSDRRGLGNIGIGAKPEAGLPNISRKSVNGGSRRDFWLGNLSVGAFLGRPLASAGIMRPVQYNSSG